MDGQDIKIKSLKINGVKNNDPEIMANTFNNYFSSVASSLSEKIANSQFPFTKYLNPPLPCSFGLTPTSSEENSQFESCNA